MFGENAISDSSSNEDEAENYVRRRPPVFRIRIDWEANLSRSEFKERFRMTPTQAQGLLEIIGTEIAPIAYTNHAITPKQRLLSALRFYATGSVYWNVADSEHVSKASIWMCVNRVTTALNNRLLNIKWPDSVNDCRKIATDFFNLSKGPNRDLPGFPLCIGAIDGTLINIIPPAECEHQYVDRHSRHSLNVQGVAGPDLKFFSLSAKWPGSVNDARCFRNSGLVSAFENGYRPFENSVLVADSIYPVKDYVVPMRTYAGMDDFFRAQARCRRVIECCWGLFKNRFRCLHEMMLKSPNDCGKMIMALGRLHNYIIETKEENENEFIPNFIGLEAEAEEEEADEDIENPMLRNEMILRVFQLFKNVNNI